MNLFSYCGVLVNLVGFFAGNLVVSLILHKPVIHVLYSPFSSAARAHLVCAIHGGCEHGQKHEFRKKIKNEKSCENKYTFATDL